MDADVFLMCCPRFQWIDVYLMKRDAGCEGNRSVFIRVFRVIRDSDK